MVDEERVTRLHKAAMAYAHEAMVAADASESARLYRLAFESEREAADMLEQEKQEEPTRSILYRSAATLALDCKDYGEAERLIGRGLAGYPPSSVAEELRHLRNEVDAAGMYTEGGAFKGVIGNAAVAFPALGGPQELHSRGTGLDSEFVGRVDGEVVFNGIEGRSGRYLFPPMSRAEILESIQRLPRSRENSRSMPSGLDPRDLGAAGWGVIFHEQEDPEIREALAPLLAHRKAQAGLHYQHLYREFGDIDGYRDGQTREDFLCNHDATIGSVDPGQMPYYLLLVGGPEKIPFQFQHELGDQYAVGRVMFDTPEEYGNYARSIVEAEAKGRERDPRVALFGVRNPDDMATALSADSLVRPLANRLVTPKRWQQSRSWQVSEIVDKEASKDRLGRLLGGDETPALLFTASHGMGFPPYDPLQQDHQGALLCQDWLGPRQWRSPVPPEFYLSGDDVSSDANLHGLVTFHVASNSAGTPGWDYLEQRFSSPPRTLAPAPFVARLPQRLLAHPKGGALAVIGQVERSWAYPFLVQQSPRQIEPFEWTLRLLMDGYPVGFAMNGFRYRYGEFAVDLTQTVQQMGYGEKFSHEEIADLWLAYDDARHYAVLGDPAVRILVR